MKNFIDGTLMRYFEKNRKFINIITVANETEKPNVSKIR